VTFDPIDCWGCPVPVLLVAIGLFAGIGLLAAGVGFNRRDAVARAPRRILLVIAAIWYLIMARSIIRLGLIWTWSSYRSASDLPWHVDRRLDFALIVVWLCLSAGVASFLVRRRRAVA
jgi:hypothetical protein